MLQAIAEHNLRCRNQCTKVHQITLLYQSNEHNQNYQKENKSIPYLTHSKCKNLHQITLLYIAWFDVKICILNFRNRNVFTLLYIAWIDSITLDEMNPRLRVQSTEANHSPRGGVDRPDKLGYHKRTFRQGTALRASQRHFKTYRHIFYSLIA